jgi:uncharacterized membrane protein
MSFRKVDAGRGVEWLKQSFEVNLKNPGIFVVNALIVVILLAVAAIVPVLNLIALPLLMPVLCAGAVYAYREQDAGRTAEVPHVFRGFQEQGRIGPLLLLGLPWIAAIILTAVFAFVFGGAAIMAAVGGSGAGAYGAFLMIALIGLALMLGAAMLTFFAIPRVMFDGLDAFAAMKESLAACLGNFLPLLVYGLIVFVASLVLGIVLILIPILGQLVLGLAQAMLNFAFMYVAYKEVFGSETATPPPPPSSI